MKFSIQIVSILVALAFFGCSDKNYMVGAQDNKKDATGSALVSIEVEKIGILAKASELSMQKLVVTLEAEGEESMVSEYTLSRLGGDEVVVLFENLASLKNWTLTAQTVDQVGEEIHSGITSFYVEKNSTIDVSLALNAQYSILSSQLSYLPDSVTHVSLYVDGVQIDTEMAARAITLSYDYLTVSNVHEVEIKCFGTLWGEEMVLYEGLVEVKPIAGEDNNYSLFLEWVGIEEPPAGAASISIQVGVVGSETIETVFEEHTIDYVTEVKGKKDKK